MSQDILIKHRDVWKKKPILKLLYTQWYEQMVSYLTPGRTLEVGGGSGNLKEFAPNVVCTDIVGVPWLDAVADAQAMPFADNSFANIVLFDVLHHIENPVFFFEEAIRVLGLGGRIVILDPYVSWASWPVYHFLHPEPVDFRMNPLDILEADPEREPFDSNQAISQLLFEKYKSAFDKRFPQLMLRYKQHLSFIVYPLTGGFDHPSLIPFTMADWLLRLERFLQPLGRAIAFRVLLVLETR